MSAIESSLPSSRSTDISRAESSSTSPGPLAARPRSLRSTSLSRWANMPGLGEPRRASRAVRSVAEARVGVAQRGLDRRERRQRVDVLGTGGAAQGEDDRALQALAGLLEIARVGGELPGDGGRQRAHPVLLERLLGAQPVGRRRPPGGAVAIAGGEGRRGERPLRAQHRHAVGARAGHRDGLLEQRGDLVGGRAAEVARRAERRQRDGPPRRVGLALELHRPRPERLGGS